MKSSHLQQIILISGATAILFAFSYENANMFLLFTLFGKL